eukprot:evm.model.scf_280EXC.2 EVM.evm.TU.scf_280EXC.2   scf_280EXC:5411-7835(-)
MGSHGFTGTTKEDCEEKIDHALQRNPFVKFMVQKLEESGCSIPREFIGARECGSEVGGGFVPGGSEQKGGVVVCHNYLGDQPDIDRALTHELIHAYDHCRAANIEWEDCNHHACSEIRAAALSGDCNWSQELLRGNWRLKGQFQACVKRRAGLSVAMNPNCSKEQAKEAVDAMFDRCFQDTAPFDRIP